MAGSKISRSPTRWSFEKEVGDIYGKIVVGASGAVTSFQGAGIASVVKEATAGQYTITLQAGFMRLLAVSASVVDSAASDIAMVQVLATPADLQADFKADKAIVIQCLDFAGVAADSASGSNILFKLEVRQNSSSVFDA